MLMFTSAVCFTLRKCYQFNKSNQQLSTGEPPPPFKKTFPQSHFFTVSPSGHPPSYYSSHTCGFLDPLSSLSLFHTPSSPPCVSLLFDSCCRTYARLCISCCMANPPDHIYVFEPLLRRGGRGGNGWRPG